MIEARDNVRQMAAYALADLAVPAGRRLISLAQNESPFPPSRQVTEALCHIADDLAAYPDPDWQILRAAIADVDGIPAEEILCGNGSMELIAALILAYVGPGDEVLSTAFGYGYFETVTQLAGGNFIRVAEPDFTVDVDHLLHAVGPATRLVCVANPGNPTGTRIDIASLRRLRDALPAHVLLLIDEAYGEFADPIEPGAVFVPFGPHTVITRTLSKAYCLAGLRVGWARVPAEIRHEMRKVLAPNNISVAGQRAAVAAVHDQAHMRNCVTEVARIKENFVSEIKSVWCRSIPSHANFQLLAFRSEATARAMDQGLRNQGIVGRRFATPGLENCIRMTIGSASVMQEVAGCLKTQLEEYDHGNE